MSVLLSVLLFVVAAALFAIGDDYFIQKQALQYENKQEQSPKASEPAAADREAALLPDAPESGSTVPDRAAEEKITLIPKKERLRLAALLLSVPMGVGLAAVSFFCYGNTVEYVLKLLCVTELLVPVALLDRRYHRIPNKVIIAGLAVWICFLMIEWIAMKQSVGLLLRTSFFGVLLGGGVFVACGIFSKKGIGAGDIKLFAVLGLIMGWQGVFNLIFFSILIIVVYGLIQLATKKKNRYSEIPMGPFVLAAMALVIMLGI